MTRKKNTDFDEEMAFYAKGKILSENQGGKEAMRHADVINARISTLLTHVSIMIAVSVVTFAEGYEHSRNFGISDYCILVDILGYLLVSFICLRGIFMIDCKTFVKHHDVLEYYVMEIRKRRNRYNLSLLMTRFLTAVFIVTLAARFARLVFG